MKIKPNPCEEYNLPKPIKIDHLNEWYFPKNDNKHKHSHECDGDHCRTE